MPETSNNEFGDKIRELSDHYQISIYHLTKIHTCLMNLYRSAMHNFSNKQEVRKVY